MTEMVPHAAAPRKRILVLTSRFPYPVIGGDRLRIYQICKLLAEEHDLTLLCLCESRREMHSPIPDDGVFKAVHRHYLPRWRSWLNCLAALPSTTPLQVAYYRSEAFKQRAAELATGHDMVLAHLIRTGDMVKDLRVHKLLEMTDAISLNYERVIHQPLSHEVDMRRLVYRVEQPRLRIYETEIVQSFDRSFLVSEVDRDYLFDRDYPIASRVDVATNGVDARAFADLSADRGQDIAFVGNMSSLQNVDAAWFAATEILPLVNRALPGARLRVIGRIPQRQRARLQRLPNVLVTGEIDSVAEAARGCGVGICPVRLGAGIQNKILEYIALGLPTVTTSVGYEGLSFLKDVEILVKDTPRDFAATIVALISNEAIAARIAAAARVRLASDYDWDRCLAPYLTHVGQLVSR